MTGDARGTRRSLEHVRVLDLGRVLAGPFCGMVLADLGAEVIKVEPPDGDVARRFAPVVDGTSAYFQWVNRNKLGVTLDLRDPAGIRMLQRLVERCDVLIENYRPGVLHRLGLPVEMMLELNPRLVVVSITGFGHDGPLADLPSFDLIAQAMSGMMAATGPEGGQPTRCGVSVGDLVPGLYGAIGALAALHERSLTGRGQHVDVAMLDSLVSILESVAMRALYTDEPVVALGNDHGVTIPFGTYRARDGAVALVCGGDAKFAVLARTLDRERWLTDARFVTNAARVAHRRELRDEIERALATRTVDEVVAQLRAVDLPAAPVLEVREALHQPQAEHRGLIHEQRDGFRTLASALRLSGSVPPTPAPALGEHNQLLPQWVAEPARSQ
jgi:CoA:oxalate CoA-transferase